MATKINMENVRRDIDLRLHDPSKGSTNRIEWNVDMNVTVSNVRKSKVFQRSRCIVFLLAAIVLIVVLSRLGREVRALQVQMQCVNVNLLVLMSKYDRLNRSLNRVWLQRGDDRKHEVNRLLEGAASLSRAFGIVEDIRNETNGSSYAYNSIVTFMNPMRNMKDKYSKSNDAHDKNKRNVSTILKALTEFEDNEKLGDEDKNNLRIERAILTLEKQNATGLDASRMFHGDVKRDDDNDDDDYHDNLDTWGEPRAGRSRRDEGRGKKRRKNKRRPKRSRRRLGPLVATFVGAVPEQHITDSVYIGPWVKSTNNNTKYSLNKFHLVEDKKSIEVTVTGLYMISTQIFYFGEPTNYSYWILLSAEGKSTTEKLVKCSTASSASATEVSCYTSVITPLQRGDRVYIQQQERDRLINMREGHSYIQLVLLSNNVRRRRFR